MIKTIILLACCCILCAAMALAAGTTSDGIRYSFNFYKKEVARGISIGERLSVLDRIIEKYRASRNNIQLLRVLTEKNYIVSWQGYLRQVHGGASDETRLSLLDGIRAKYRRTDVDLTMVEAEYAALRASRKAPVVPASPAISLLPATTAPLQAAPPAPSAQEAPKPSAPEPAPVKTRTAKHIAFGATGLGALGLYGYDMIVNWTDRFSLAAGCGMNPLFTSVPNARSSAGQTTYQGLLRYGENVYCAVGLQKRLSRGEAVAGTARVQGEITNYGLPLVVGIETGKKRGLFFNIELAYIPYFGDAGRELIATDPASGEKTTLKLDSPQCSAWFGFGIGLYLF